MTDAPDKSPPVSVRTNVGGVVVPNRATRGQRLLAWLLASVMRLVSATIRYRLNGARGPAKLPEEPVIFALWHNRLCLSMEIYKNFVRPDHSTEHLAALISASKDGAFLAAVLKNFGVEAVRGSSSRRGAQALLELSSWAERGFDLAVTPDGPRGPRYVVKEGVMMLAQVTGLPVIPCSYHLNWKIQVRSWDRFQIPLPFARCMMFMGEPITVPRDATAEDRVQLRQRLQEELMRLTQGD